MHDTFYKPFGLSVRAVILDDEGRCLLLRRSPGSRTNPGKWELPGGKAEGGEPFDRALYREISEETGLKVSLLHGAGVADSEMPSVRVVHLIMEASLVSGPVRLSDEHDAFVWAGPGEIASMELADWMKPFIISYFNKK